jgi:PhnB protein
MTYEPDAFMSLPARRIRRVLCKEHAMNHSTCVVTFDGQCLEAFECYAEILGGSIEVVDLQRPFPRLVQHALLRVGTWTMNGHDAKELDSHQSGVVAVMMCCSDPDEAWKLYYALAAGGQLTTPMNETKWAKLAGGLVDRFGTAWIVCHGVRHSSPRLLAHSPDLTFDVLPLDRGLRDDGYAARQPLPVPESLSKTRGALRARATV